jgi:hypothetical protein
VLGQNRGDFIAKPVQIGTPFTQCNPGF